MSKVLTSEETEIPDRLVSFVKEKPRFIRILCWNPKDGVVHLGFPSLEDERVCVNWQEVEGFLLVNGR